MERWILSTILAFCFVVDVYTVDCYLHLHPLVSFLLMSILGGVGVVLGGFFIPPQTTLKEPRSEVV